MSANIGVVGLAVMGSNLARNLASREGNTVAVYNRTWARTETLVTEHSEAGFVAVKTIEEFAASLSRPRTALIMVQAGKGTDAVIDELVAVFEPGDMSRRAACPVSGPRTAAAIAAAASRTRPYSAAWTNSASSSQAASPTR